MATRALRDLSNATINTYLLKSGQTIVEGDIVSLVTDDEHVQPTAAGGQDPIGVALAGQTTAEGEVPVAMLGGGGIAAVKLGAAGTFGKWCKVHTTAGRGGDLTPNAAGATYVGVVGQFLQTGVTGDLVGVQLGGFLAIET